ncbi:MAG: hypothetical protein JST17_16050, partial [Bacteroidetes bacterium]|nr:hypothetical protein [Bacteroidota bacterium]
MCFYQLLYISRTVVLRLPRHRKAAEPMDRNGSQPGRFATQASAMACHENPSGMNAVLEVFLILSIGS